MYQFKNCSFSDVTAFFIGKGLLPARTITNATKICAAKCHASCNQPSWHRFCNCFAAASGTKTVSIPMCSQVENCRFMRQGSSSFNYRTHTEKVILCSELIHLHSNERLSTCTWGWFNAETRLESNWTENLLRRAL